MTFQIVILGCTGGPRENNISGYLCSPIERQEWIALDAGSLLGGIDRALEKNTLKEISFTDPNLIPAAEMLIKHVRGFLISHAHLDHIVGLVINSQVDEKKYILGINPTIDNLRDHIFNGKIWPNYGSEGIKPILNRYEYVRLPLYQQTKIPNTTMCVEAFLLSHPNGYPSTAFLLEYKGEYLLYFGDTSSDQLEEKKCVSRIWNSITPLLKNKKIHGMFLECSFSRDESDLVRFGHLSTNLMIQELHNLANIADMSLEGFPVIVTHRKESMRKTSYKQDLILNELSLMNDLGINFIFPNQGDRIIL